MDIELKAERFRDMWLGGGRWEASMLLADCDPVESAAVVLKALDWLNDSEVLAIREYLSERAKQRT